MHAEVKGPLWESVLSTMRVAGAAIELKSSGWTVSAFTYIALSKTSFFLRQFLTDLELWIH